jgi:uncharacterized protein involved in outer membrane biogenesis
MTLARLFVFFGSLLVLALFAALIGPLFIDWTNYREDFEREASRILGQEVVVNGSADARLIPFPSVTFNDVDVGTREDGEPMMHIARFTMNAELAPFLSGEIRIFDMQLEEPQLTIALNEEGALDWATRSETDLPAGTVVLERVEITDGTVTIEDRQNGRIHVIEEVNSVLSADSLRGPWRIEGTASIAGESGAFSVATGMVEEDGSIRLRTRILPDSRPVSVELEGDASIDEQRPHYAGSFTLQVLEPVEPQQASAAPGVAATRTTLRGTGMFEATSERLRIDEYRLEVGAVEDPYVVTGEATIDTGEEPEFLLIAEGQQIDVDRLATEPAEGEAAEEPQPLSAAERLETFRRVLEQIPIPDLAGRVSLSLPAIIAGDTTLREVSLEAEPRGTYWEVSEFAVSLPGRTRVEASGELRLDEGLAFSGDLLLASRQPSGFASWLTEDVHPAIRGLESAGFQADVELTDDLQRFTDLELIAGEATITGRFERTAADDSPAIDLDLVGDSVNFDTLAALVGLFADGAENHLASHDIAARMKAGHFTAAGVAMEDVETVFTLRNGLLDIDRLLVADLAGANISASGVFSDLTGRPQGSGRIELNAGEMEALLALAERTLAPYVDLSELSRRASLFRGTDLAMDIQLGSARESASAETAGYTVRAQGTTGGSEILLEASSDAPFAAFLDEPVRIDIEASNPEARQLLAQMGLAVLPFDTGQPLQLSARLDGRISGGADVSLELLNDRTRLAAQGNVAFMDGRLQDGMLDVNLAAEDLEPYLLLAGIGLPGFGIGLPAELSTVLTVTPEDFLLDELEGEAADNGFSGSLSIGRGEAAAVTGRLSTEVVDAAWLAEVVYGQPLRDPGEGVWSSAEFTSPQAPGLALDLEFEAERAYLGHPQPAEGLTAGLTYEDGQLRIAGAEADWLGGRLAGALAFGNIDQSGTLELRMELAGGDVATALAPLGEKPPAQGNADVALSVEATGMSARAMAGALTGSGALRLADVRIAGLDGEAFGEILTAADAEGTSLTQEGVRPVAREALTEGSLVIEQAAVPLTIAGGVVRAQNIVLESENAALRGGVNIDLQEMTVEAGFQAEFDAGDEELPGATPALGLALTGPLASPELVIDATQMSNFLSLRAYERERQRVERVQAAVLEKQRLRREAALIRERMRERRDARLLEVEEAAARRDQAAREAAERVQQEIIPVPTSPPAAEPVETEPVEAEPAEAEPVEPAPEPAPAAPSEGVAVAPADRVEQAPLPPPAAPAPAPQQAAPPQPQQTVPPAPQPLPELDFESLPGVDLNR